MAFNIVLVEPEIPNNTGNIGRLSLASGSVLHLVKPFGFELTDARLKRAGLDYWKHISVKTYNSLEDFLSININEKMVFLSAGADKNYTEIDYEDNLFLFLEKSLLVCQINCWETMAINYLKYLFIVHMLGV